LDKRYVFVTLAILIFATTAFAVDFSGDYLVNADGNQVTLSLKQSNDGAVTGLLSITAGKTLSVSGSVDEDVIIGSCEGGATSIPFEAHFETSELSLTLIGDSEQNSRVIRFPIGNKTGSQVNRQEVPAKLSMIPNTQKQVAAQKLDGNWVCKTAQGNMTLQFETFDVLRFNGDQAKYKIQDSSIIVSADGNTIAYPYTLKNTELTITFPEGVKAIFTRDSSAGAGAVASNGTIFQQLVGTWKDVRSSGNTVIQLSGDGQYSYYSDYVAGNSQEGQANWGYGNSSKDAGTWTAKGSPEEGTIYYQSQNGERDSLTYHVHVEHGEPFWNEYIFDGKLYCKE